MSDEGFQLAWTDVQEGWRVLASDGSDVGKVEQAVGDRESDIFEGFEVDVEVMGPDRFVSFEHVVGIAEGHIRLDLTPAPVRELPEQHEQPSLELSGEKASLNDRLRTDVHEMAGKIDDDRVEGTGKRKLVLAVVRRALSPRQTLGRSVPERARSAITFDSCRKLPSSNSITGSFFWPVIRSMSDRPPRSSGCLTSSYWMPASSSAFCACQQGCGPLISVPLQRCSFMVM
jgi:hypothetical protein